MNHQAAANWATVLTAALALGTTVLALISFNSSMAVSRSGNRDSAIKSVVDATEAYKTEALQEGRAARLLLVLRSAAQSQRDGLLSDEDVAVMAEYLREQSLLKGDAVLCKLSKA